MRMQRIGIWEETRVASGRDSGLYLEAVEVPAGQPRFAQVSHMLIADADIALLNRGAVVELDLDDMDLVERIN